MKSKKSNILIVLCLVLGICICFMGYKMFILNNRNRSVERLERKDGLTTDEFQSKICNPLVAGILPGAKVPNFYFNSIDHEKYTLDDFLGNKTFIYLPSNKNNGCILFYPLINEWAKKYYQEMNFVVIYEDFPNEAHLEKIDLKYIKLGINCNNIRGIFQTDKSRFFLIDEQGTVEYSSTIDFDNWIIATKIVESFAKDSTIPDGTIMPSCATIGNQLPEISELPTVNGEVVDLNQVQNGIIYIFSPKCSACEMFSPYLNNYISQYQKNLEFYLVYPGIRGEKRYILEKEYVDKYKVDFEPRRLEDSKSYVRKYLIENKLDYDVVLDEKDETIKRWGLRVIPSIFFVKNGKVIYGLTMGHGYGVGLVDPVPIIESKIKEILQ